MMTRTFRLLKWQVRFKSKPYFQEITQNYKLSWHYLMYMMSFVCIIYQLGRNLKPKRQSLANPSQIKTRKKRQFTAWETKGLGLQPLFLPQLDNLLWWNMFQEKINLWNYHSVSDVSIKRDEEVLSCLRIHKWIHMIFSACSECQSFRIWQQMKSIFLWFKMWTSGSISLLRW